MTARKPRRTTQRALPETHWSSSVQRADRERSIEVMLAQGETLERVAALFGEQPSQSADDDASSTPASTTGSTVDA